MNLSSKIFNFIFIFHFCLIGSCCANDNRLINLITESEFIISMNEDGSTNNNHLKGEDFHSYKKLEWIELNKKHNICFIFKKPRVTIKNNDVSELCYGIQASVFKVNNRNSIFVDGKIYYLDDIIRIIKER